MSSVSREEFETQQKKIKALEKKIKKLSLGEDHVKAPKRLSGYNVFLSEKSKDYKDFDKSERFGKISSEWKKLTDDEKEEFTKKSKKINEKALKAFNASKK